MSKFELVIDCPPGATRPDGIATQVLQDTGIVLNEPVSCLFGSWTWEISEDYSELYEKNKKLIGDRLKELYSNGIIRYAAW